MKKYIRSDRVGYNFGKGGPKYIIYVFDGDDNKWKPWGGWYRSLDEFDADAFLDRINHPNFPNPEYNYDRNYLDVKVIPNGEDISEYVESSTSIVTASIADEIYELSNVNTFWDDVRSLVGDGDYEDYQIKDLQRVADRRYDELVNGYEQKEWSVSIWGYVFIVEADSKEEAIDIAIKEYNDNPPDGIKVDPVEDAHQIGAKPVR